MIAEPEPEVPALRPKWQARVVRALAGLAELGDPAASSAVLPLLQHKEARSARPPRLALAWMARPGNANAIFALQGRAATQRPRGPGEAALGLAYDRRPLRRVDHLHRRQERPGPRARPARRPRPRPDDAFIAYLDHAKDRLRDKALLLVLMRELVEGDGVPDRCLAALVLRPPARPPVAAQALEHFGDDAAFAKFVTDLINDRGEGKPKWTIPARPCAASPSS
jgi:hypothetical protein